MAVTPPLENLVFMDLLLVAIAVRPWLTIGRSTRNTPKETRSVYVISGPCSSDRAKRSSSVVANARLPGGLSIPLVQVNDSLKIEPDLRHTVARVGPVL